MRVLLVSNDADLRVALQILLREVPRCDVVAAVSNYEAAISIVRSDRPDLMVMDWDLPNERAAGILALVRQLERVPLVVAIGEEETARADAVAAGVDVYVLKQRAPEHLISTILKMIDESQHD